MKTRMLMLIVMQLFFLTSFSQDVVFFKNGEQLKVIVSEVSSKEVKYFEYGAGKKEIKVIRIADIKMIRYEDGTEDVFSKENANVPKKDDGNGIKADRSHFTEQGRIRFQVGLGLVNPLRDAFSNFEGSAPLVLACDANLNRRLSLGAILVKAKGRGEFTYFYVFKERASAEVTFLGLTGNIHVYTNSKLDLTAGMAAGITSISASDGSSERIYSTRYNAEISYLLFPHFGVSARGGIWGETRILDLGVIVKF